MGAVFNKVHEDAQEWLRRNILVILVVLLVYALMVAGNYAHHGGDLGIGIIAGITATVVMFDVSFLIAGPLYLAGMTVLTYFIERRVGTR